MQNSLTYRFPNPPAANRFLNELSHWSVADVKAKLHAADAVRVSYEYNAIGFDYTCSELDDLAGWFS